MPKSKEFVEDSDSDEGSNARKQASLSDDETEAKPAKSKPASTTSKTEVSDAHKRRSAPMRTNDLFSQPQNERKPVRIPAIQRHHQKPDPTGNGSTKYVVLLVHIDDRSVTGRLALSLIHI